MNLPERQQTLLRLTADQEQRVKRQAHLSGLTKQALLLVFVLKGLEGMEVNEPQRKRDAHREGRPLAEPAGLGITRRATAPAPPIEQTTSGQVVVNVNGSSSPTNSDTISRLATWITTAAGYQREARLRDAVEILKCSTDSEADRIVLAKQLDATIAARDSSKPARTPTFALLKSFLS